MAKKFDTNPLDPNFPEEVKAKAAQTASLPDSNGSTTKFADPLETEEQTRKFTETEFGAFNSSFGNQESQPTVYQPQKLHSEDAQTKSRSLNIGSISLPENILMMLPYLPFGYIGLITGIIELIFIPKSEPRVRYHAAQGIAANLGVKVVIYVLGFLAFGSDLVEVASFIFWLVTTIMLLVFAFKAWQGKPIHIETVQDLTDWIEDKIAPQK
ncbi:MAG: hypothetical protein KDB79_06690 [Acidobacteria bacterium]|nr:hypothetical protein [Acidobacteriota bacterium]